MSGWRPIETAPLDGSEILTYRIAIAANIAVAFYDGDGWRVCGTLRKTSLLRVTHWMPLPAPPRKMPSAEPTRIDRLVLAISKLREKLHRRWMRRAKVSFTWPRDDLQ